MVVDLVFISAGFHCLLGTNSAIVSSLLEELGVCIKRYTHLEFRIEYNVFAVTCICLHA